MIKEIKEFEEKVIEVARVSRTVKGGRRLRFRALVVIGDRAGRVGLGLGKANEVNIAVNKAVSNAKKNIINVEIVNDTIRHEIMIKYGSAFVFLKPAAPGTSIIAGGAVRSVIELAGIKNILSKIYGSSNKINNVKATIEALKIIKNDSNRYASKNEANKSETKSNSTKEKQPSKKGIK